MPGSLLSKSKYLIGLQCPRYLWVACNEPERIPETDPATQHLFDQGHLVGELAKELFPGGIAVPPEDFMGNIAATREALRRRRPLFEAGLLLGRIYSRVDILNPVNEDKWDIVEVKSSTLVKDVHIDDVAFQRLRCEENGLKIRSCFLVCINNQYVKHGEIVPAELFILQDVSDAASAAGQGMGDRIRSMLKTMDAPSCPEATIGPQCNKPYDCPLAECREGLPEHSVFTLYQGGAKCHEIHSCGILDIADISTSYDLNHRQRIQRSCVISGKPYIDASSLGHFLASLHYPLYFLDFETIDPAVPLFNGTRPYQHIPFQFSLHVQATPDAETHHHWHLAEGPQDPRPELLTRLNEAIGNQGSIIVYYKPFEQSALRDLGTAFPAYREWSEAVISRLVDLHAPFRSFHYYHPAQRGSASIKSVLPAVTGSGYECLSTANGGDASLRYLAITYGEVSPEERSRTREELLAYCGLDSGGMVRIVKRLEQLVRQTRL